jgi:adenine-specific DNA-methyltransferase
MTTSLELFNTTTTRTPIVALGENNYYPTPAWLAERVIERCGFDRLGAGAHVLEPGCGDGRFLDALRASGVRATGVELNPLLAEQACAKGHAVIVGDFTTCELPANLTGAIGNPPYAVDLIDALLLRLASRFESGARAAMLLPTYFFQTSSHVQTLRNSWNIAVELVPRNVFTGLSMPLAFGLFTRSHERLLWGLAFYDEAEDVLSMHMAARTAVSESPRSWKQLVVDGLEANGGTATLDQLYAYGEPRRPSGNRWWREKIRQVVNLADVATRTGPATYSQVAA